ncbi:unnamed protein product [Penicillium glandicola]
MQSSEKEQETHTNRVPKMAQSQFKLSDYHLTFGHTEGPQYMSQNEIYPAAQSSGNYQTTSGGLNSPRIKKEFPDENGQGIKSWDRFKSSTIKQEPGTEQEPVIKIEPQEFNDVLGSQGHLLIDLTEDKPPTHKRPMLRAELLMAIYQHQKAARKSIEAVEQPVESLFVQDDDSSRSISSKTSDSFLEQGEDDTGFNEIQRRFQSLQSPSMEQQIEFEKRKEEELERRRKAKNDKICELNVQAETERATEISSVLEEHPQLQEPQGKAQTEAELKKSATVKPPVTRVSKWQIKKAREIGLAQLLSKEATRKRDTAEETEPETAPETEQVSGTKTKQKKNRQPPTTLSNKEIRSIFTDGGRKKGNDPLPPGFVSTEKNKQKAFREMLAIIPVAEKAEAREDISILDEATRTFNPSARADGQGKWKVRGLETSLMVNQILAASWMCKRETSSSKPNGGLLCDMMGFGKTLSTLACIVNRKVPSQPQGPTLIVAPRNLIQTWISQIRQHCDQKAVGRVIAHCSGSRVETNDLAYYLRQQDIVLTTYSEISSSYPDLKPPPEVKTNAAIEEWWYQEYDEKAGAFHQIHWHRIVLDVYRSTHYQEQDDQNLDCGSCSKWGVQMGFNWHAFAQEFKLTFERSSVDELYALFTFIDVPNSHPYHVFMHNFCDGSKTAKDRLINMLRAIIHRKTHESRHMGRPLIELKRFNLKEVKVEFYPVEKQIYSAIAERFIKKVNATKMKKQTKCILTMILKLQMFISHPLAAEDYLKQVCNSNNTLDAQLKSWVKDETSPGNPSPSGMIARCCIAGKYQTRMPVAPLRSRTESENLRPRPSGNSTELASDFQKKIKELFENAAFYELDNRSWFCPRCNGIPAKAIVRDCQHLYCEECFDALADEKENTEGIARWCCRCEIPIKKAAFYGLYDDFDTPQLEGAEGSSLEPVDQQKRPAGEDQRTENESRTKKRRKDKHATFSEWLLADGNPIPFDDESEHESQTEVEDETPDEEDLPCEEEFDPDQDWIAAFGRSMPGSKFDEITTRVKKWFEEDSTAKVVIFTQYVNSTRLLRYLCEENDWKYSQITGRMANRSREIHLDNFRTQDETKIMIASIKTGGLGLDFSVANKCILVDLWWNEAVQDQAFFRLWRLGQQRDVECVMLMVNRSIDDWMGSTQKRKAKEISEVMSQRVLTDRSTLKELLEMFGEVTDDPEKGFMVHLGSKGATQDAAQNASNPATKPAPKATPKATSRASSGRKGTRSAPAKKRS